MTRADSNDRLHIALINFCGPGFGPGSPIILQRHLSLLRAAGHTVTVCTPVGGYLPNSDDHAVDKFIEIPPRRFGWPPFRRKIKILCDIRAFLVARFIKKRIYKSDITHILTMPCEIYPDVATNISRKLNVPLIVIHHDQEEVFLNTCQEKEISINRTISVLRNSSVVLSVTKELPEVYGCRPDIIRVMRPIPGSGIIEKNHRDSPRSVDFVYAGSIFPLHVEPIVRFGKIIKEYGGVLHIIADPRSEVIPMIQRQLDNVEIVYRFKTNDEAVQFVSDKMASFLVIYSPSIEGQAWSRTSFPSKFVDFSRAGVPILVVAPVESAISAWCRTFDWATFTPWRRDDEIRTLVSTLSNEKNWTDIASRQNELSSKEFDPIRIHAQFMNALYDTLR